jgi:hypothetical protein
VQKHAPARKLGGSAFTSRTQTQGGGRMCTCLDLVNFGNAEDQIRGQPEGVLLISVISLDCLNSLCVFTSQRCCQHHHEHHHETSQRCCQHHHDSRRAKHTYLRAEKALTSLGQGSNSLLMSNSSNTFLATLTPGAHCHIRAIGVFPLRESSTE